MLFDRPKDWLDVEAVAKGGHVMLDGDYIRSALELFVDPDDYRFDRCRRSSEAHRR